MFSSAVMSTTIDEIDHSYFARSMGLDTSFLTIATVCLNNYYTRNSDIILHAFCKCLGFVKPCLKCHCLTLTLNSILPENVLCNECPLCLTCSPSLPPLTPSPVTGARLCVSGSAGDGCPSRHAGCDDAGRLQGPGAGD